jgi:hypothetical protein
MKYLLVAIFTFAAGMWLGNEPKTKFNGDFKLQQGEHGELGKIGHTAFQFKEANFKIPDEYNTGYDSVQIILGWDDAPIVNFCYPKHTP